MLITPPGNLPEPPVEIRPFARLGIDGVWDGNIAGRNSIALEPYRSIYSKGPMEFRLAGILDVGSDFQITDQLSMLIGASLRAFRYLNYGSFDGITGAFLAEGTAVDLPGDLDMSVGYIYRGDLSGGRGHVLSSSAEKPLPLALVGYFDAGYGWSGAGVATGNHGPFVDFGASRRFREWGTTLSGSLGAGQQTRTDRNDFSLSATLGLSQRLIANLHLWIRGRLDWVNSSASEHSYVGPGATLGTAWLFH